MKTETKAKFDKEGKLVVDALGRSEFNRVFRFDNGSTETVKDGVEILTEKNENLKK